MLLVCFSRLGFPKRGRTETGFISVTVSKFVYQFKAAGFLSDSLIIMEVAILSKHINDSVLT